MMTGDQPTIMKGGQPTIISYNPEHALQLSTLKKGISMKFKLADEVMMNRCLKYLSENYGAKNLIITTGLTNNTESFDNTTFITTTLYFDFNTPQAGSRADEIYYYIDTGMRNVYTPKQPHLLRNLYGATFEWHFYYEENATQKRITVDVALNGEAPYKYPYKNYIDPTDVNPEGSNPDWITYILGGYAKIENDDPYHSYHKTDASSTPSSAALPSEDWLIICTDVKIGEEKIDPKKINWNINNSDGNDALRYKSGPDFSSFFRLGINTSDGTASEMN